MVRSRLPLLGLFGAVVMVSPKELPGNFLPTPLTDPEVRAPLAEAVEKYNHEESDSPNYYKVLSLHKAKDPKFPRVIFLAVKFVKTRCEKKARRMKFKRIQKCKRLPRNHKEVICFFVATNSLDSPFQMKLDNYGCPDPDL